MGGWERTQNTNEKVFFTVPASAIDPYSFYREFKKERRDEKKEKRKERKGKKCWRGLKTYTEILQP